MLCTVFRTLAQTITINACSCVLFQAITAVIHIHGTLGHVDVLNFCRTLKHFQSHLVSRQSIAKTELRVFKFR